MKQNLLRVILVVLVLIGVVVLLIWRAALPSLNRKALFEAIRADNAPRVLALLQAGADPNARQPDTGSARPLVLPGSARPEGQTPLLAALYLSEKMPQGQTINRYNPHPNPAIIRALLEAGADASATDRSWNPPIFYAVASGHIDVVDLLLKHGAKVDQTSVQGPLLLTAAGQGRVEMMRYLLEQGTDVNATDAVGTTALISTVRYAHQVDAVKLLLDHHIAVNARDRSGKTALYYAQHPFARRSAEQNKHLPEVITLLQKAGGQ